MEELPKIAQQRLRDGGGGTAGSPESTGASPRPVGAEHPDADLLSAFVEKKLLERERATLVNHLAECATCREIVALACQPADEAVQPARVERRKPPWFALPVVRWGAVAAAVGAIVVAVVLHRPEILKFRETPVTQTTPAPAPAESAMPSKPEPVAPPLEKARAGSSPQQGALQSQAVAKRERMTTARLNRVEAKEAGGATVEAQTSPQRAALARREAAAGSVAGALAPAAPSGAVLLGAGQSATIAKTPAPSAPSAGVPPVQTEAEVTEAPTVHDEVQATEGRSAAPALNAPQPSRAPALQGAASPAVAGAPRVKMAKAKSGRVNARWSISSSGVIERSQDGGKTWEEIHVDDSAMFRAVATAGDEIWAGGSKGALYHSSDGGATWNRVTPRSDETVLDDDVVSIRFPDPQHLTVTTASGQTWATSDSGQTWEMP